MSSSGSHPEPVPFSARYYIGGREHSFYIRCTFGEFYAVAQCFEELEAARLAFRRATWRGDFGEAIAAELAGDQAAAEVMARLSQLRLDTMQPVPTTTIRDVIAGRRRDVDRRFEQQTQGEEAPDKAQVKLRTVPKIKSPDGAYVQLMRTATALCKTNPW